MDKNATSAERRYVIFTAKYFQYSLLDAEKENGPPLPKSTVSFKFLAVIIVIFHLAFLKVLCSGVLCTKRKKCTDGCELCANASTISYCYLLASVYHLHTIDKSSFSEQSTHPSQYVETAVRHAQLILHGGMTPWFET